MEKVKSSKIAVYGGAFDPIHNGHLTVIARLLNSGLFDSVMVVPSGDRPDKRYVAAGIDRLEMVSAALKDNFLRDDRVSVVTDQALGRIRYGTIDLVEHLRRRYPAAELVFVIGAELIADLPRWREADRLKREVSFLIMRRPGASNAMRLDGWKLQEFSDSDESGVNVSSTTLRRFLAAGVSCAGLMPANVITYCKEKMLYVGC